LGKDGIDLIDSSLLHAYDSVKEAREFIPDYLDWYNRYRPHSQLGRKEISGQVIFRSSRIEYHAGQRVLCSLWAMVVAQRKTLGTKSEKDNLREYLHNLRIIYKNCRRSLIFSIVRGAQPS
jgi:hypothetical protein